MKTPGRLCWKPDEGASELRSDAQGGALCHGIRAVWRTLFAGEHLVGFLVVEEALRLGIPLEGAAQTHGGMSQQAGAARTVTHLGGGRGVLTGAYAGEPGQVVIVLR